MSSGLRVAYKFGDYCLIPADKQLLRGAVSVPLPPKAFDTLAMLVENQGRLVQKDEFLKRVWQDSFVEEVALAHAISQLRKVLRDGMDDVNCIETVPKRGYRFIAPVEVVNPGSHDTLVRETLAVLPFENLDAGPEREYLADGLTEEVITVLGQVDPEHLGVIGRTSMSAYRRTTKSLAEIGRELGAGFLLESSIRSEAGHLRITSKLIRARDQVQIWSASYDSEPGSVLAFQRELAGAIARQVRLRLSPERLSALEGRQTRQVEAYDLYLHGRYLWSQLTPLTTRRALELYARATELDPGYALAWCGQADAYSAAPINGDAPPFQMWPRARDAVAHAVSAGPNLAETQVSVGLFKVWLDWDYAAAETAYRKAIALDPRSGLAYLVLGVVLSLSMRHEEAVAALRCARELDPLDFTRHAISAQVAFNARDYLAAIDFGRQARALNPQFWVTYYQLAQTHERMGNHDLALEALQQAGSFSSGNSKLIGLRGYLFARLGRTGEALEVLNTLEAVSRERYVPPYAAALVHAGLGQQNASLEWLDRAYEAHDVHLMLLPVDPKWDAFRDDSRFLALIERCGFTTGGNGPTPISSQRYLETPPMEKNGKSSSARPRVH